MPKYSEILPSDVDTSIKLTNYLKLKIPLLSSAMDTVTESKMAIAIAKAGGIGIIHRNLDIKKQILEIKKVKKQKLLVGAAVGAGPSEFKRAEAILKEKIDMIVVDTAHGHTKKVSEIIKFIKKTKDKKTALCAGNIATPAAAKFLLKLGVDVIKVGIGPGSICTTRLVAGIGVPQLSAILEVRNGIKNKNVPTIKVFLKSTAFPKPLKIPSNVKAIELNGWARITIQNIFSKISITFSYCNNNFTSSNCSTSDAV